jgi:hypothetical protein
MPRRSLPFPLPQRQVHLDFHTSPLIPDVGTEFDARAFAATVKRAHIDSVTVFAKCHHGMCYYPAKTGTPHPALRGRDLLGEMITALHREGIRAPIYTTVTWDEDVAARFPQWRQMRPDGRSADEPTPAELAAAHPGRWKYNDWVNPDYQDYLEAQTRELCRLYPVDGIFYDILFYKRGCHASAAARRLRAKLGLEADTEENFDRFESAALDQFGRRFTRLLHGLKPRATVFYNSGFEIMGDSRVGGRVRDRHLTHIEIESLPSGFWGYHHFPRLARGAGRWGRPWIAMTGRFQKMWGDFGGIKPQAALEFECFRAQALGGGNSVGDQLPPRGTLDPAAYELIGGVYAQCAAAEKFYSGSREVPHIGILTANWPGRDLTTTGKSDEGAVMMCEEAHYECALLDELSDLSKFALLILPDAVVVTPRLRSALAKYHARGGKLLLSHHAGRDARGNFALDFLRLRFAGDEELFPTYWRARKDFDPAFAQSDRVHYAQGTKVLPSASLRVLVDRVLPYFKRSDIAFSSHFQTPPVARPGRHPAVVAGRGFVYFADPIFREYRQTGNLAARDVWRRTMARLIGPPPFGDGLPTTMLCVPRRRGRDLLLTLLHYIPVRKALDIDVIEERMGFGGETLRLPPAIKQVRVHGTDEMLARSADGFRLPESRGRLLLECPGAFAPPTRR